MSEQYKPSYKRVNQISDAPFPVCVGEDFAKSFGKKFKEWEIRRGLRTPENAPVLRGVALRAKRAGDKKKLAMGAKGC
jgi:hypothetical protein